jgi:hypothetical protein
MKIMSRPHHLYINGECYTIHPVVGAWLSGLCAYEGDVRDRIGNALGVDLVEKFNQREKEYIETLVGLKSESK